MIRRTSIALLFTSFFWMNSNAQASSDAIFNLTLQFDPAIPVGELEIFYVQKNGNTFESLRCTTHYQDNQLTFEGHNDFILWVGFPTLYFKYSVEVYLPGASYPVQKDYCFYLYSTAPVSSYTGVQTEAIHFAQSDSWVIASILCHNHDDAHSEITYERIEIPEEWILEEMESSPHIRITPQ